MNLTSVIALFKGMKLDTASLTRFAPLIVMALRWLADMVEKDPDTVFGWVEALIHKDPQ